MVAGKREREFSTMGRVAVGEPTSSVSRRLGVRGKGSSLAREESEIKCNGKGGF